MMSDTAKNLVTTYTFKSGKECIVKMRVISLKGSLEHHLEITVSDKFSSEDWQSTFDPIYIENLTYKTGNYKQFDVFTAMLRSGLLKTSNCISLDLLTFDDLETLRAKKFERDGCTETNDTINKRRYLILTYTVEFDRIHYPLPLEYCGPPDPEILQATIRKLKSEIERLQSIKLRTDVQARIDQLIATNNKLVEENRRLTAGKGVQKLISKIKTLELNVSKERASFRLQIQALRAENTSLKMRIRNLTDEKGNRRRTVSRSPTPKRHPSPSQCSRLSSNRSRSPSVNSVNSYNTSTSFGSRTTTTRSRANINVARYDAVKNTRDIEFKSLESRIQMLQKMLREGVNLN